MVASKPSKEELLKFLNSPEVKNINGCGVQLARIIAKYRFSGK